MPSYPVTLFLPAAGLGERLRPITNHLPKPLLPILGKPLIELVLDRLAKVCDGGIGINLHWKSDLIRAWAVASPYAERITFFPEHNLLGTGGALKNAAAFLSSGLFLVHNADILLDIDYARLVETHIKHGNIATLATHRIPRLSNVVIDDAGLVIDVENPGDSRPDPNRFANKVAYTGIALYSPEILSFLPSGVSHATTAWIAAARTGRRVEALDFTGSYWTDIGTPASYAGAVLDALQQQGEMVFRSPASQCGNIDMNGFVVIESGGTVQEKSRVRNCIIMPGANVSSEFDNAIVGPDYSIQLTESEMQPSMRAQEQKMVSIKDPLLVSFFDNRSRNSCRDGDDGVVAILIGHGGSDRRYFRIKCGNQTAVLMECTQEDADYERHLVYSRFFETHAVPVPKLLASDLQNRRALFEDLGDASLYAQLQFPRTTGQIENIYRSILDILVTLHGEVTRHIAECPPLGQRIFDYNYLRWETSYFLERFVSGLAEHPIRNHSALENELHLLANLVDAYPKVVIHRDFQAQNIIISAGTPRIIDFQGARMAPAAYDLASLLWDPYYRLDDRLRTKLIEYYTDRMSSADGRFSCTAFAESLILCRLQRHMQALGAYGFLSTVKKKPHFRKYIPEALRLLKTDVIIVENRFPELCNLACNLPTIF